MSNDVAQWLRGKRVLVTRPREQAQGLVAALAAQGAVPVEFPVIEIEGLPATEVEREKIIELDRFDLVVLVSANAARFALDWVDRYWPQLPPHLAWLAVGAATERLLAAAGIAASIPDGHANSEALLQLPLLAAVANRKILIIRGIGGRSLLQDELARRGAQVESVALYRRCLPQLGAADIEELLNGQPPDALMATSVDAVTNLDLLLSRVGNWHYAVPLVVASARIADAARQRGFSRIFTASGAADECILQALNVIG